MHVLEIFVFSFGSDPLLLNGLLYVQDIHKNLLSVSKFAKDNSVFFEFYPDRYFVKDMKTQQVVLRGVKKNVLY